MATHSRLWSTYPDLFTFSTAFPTSLLLPSSLSLPSLYRRYASFSPSICFSVASASFLVVTRESGLAATPLPTYNVQSRSPLKLLLTHSGAKRAKDLGGRASC